MEPTTTGIEPTITSMKQASNRVQRPFNRNFFDRSDPAASIGIELSGFSLYYLYSDLGIEKVKKVQQELYNRVYSKIDEKVKSSDIIDVSYNIYQYVDNQHQHKEGARDYLEVVRETPRGTRATVLARFLTYGDDLFLSVSSYVMGEQDNGKFLQRVLFSLPLLLLLSCPLLWLFPSTINSFQPGVPTGETIQQTLSFMLCSLVFCLIPVALLLVLLWVDVIRGFSLHRSLGLSIRQAFNTVPQTDTFNVDDIFMFYKSVIPTILYTIREVFNENEIDTKTLDEFITSVNNVTNISQTVNNIAPNQGVQGIVTQAVKSTINPLG